MTGVAGRTDADPSGDGPSDGFPPGTNVLVTGGDDGEAVEFALSHLTAGGGPVSIVSTDAPPSTLAGVVPTGPDAPTVRIVDCTGRADPDAPADPSVTASPAELPAVGEAAVAALTDDPTPAAAGVCLDSVSTLVERATVQGVYKLLYVLARRVRSRDALAVYTWAGDADPKTVRILGRALDYRVSLDAPAGPTVDRLPGRGGDG